MAPALPPDLLPEDPDEILRIYRSLPLGVRTGDRSLQAAKLADGAGAGAEIGLLAAPLWLLGQEYGAVWSIASISAILAASNALANWPFPGRNLTFATGPLTGVSRFLENRRIAEMERAAPPDPSSLDVLEPVARAQAERVLRASKETRARLIEASPGLPALVARLVELDAQAQSETDPEWREAVAERRARVAAELERRRAADAESVRLARKLKEEADALKAALERLTLRRKLLAEIAADRRGQTPTTETYDRSETAALRERLAALGGSLSEADTLATARLGAEREMASWKGD